MRNNNRHSSKCIIIITRHSLDHLHTTHAHRSLQRICPCTDTRCRQKCLAPTTKITKITTRPPAPAIAPAPALETVRTTATSATAKAACARVTQATVIEELIHTVYAVKIKGFYFQFFLTSHWLL